MIYQIRVAGKYLRHNGKPLFYNNLKQATLAGDVACTMNAVFDDVQGDVEITQDAGTVVATRFWEGEQYGDWVCYCGEGE